jgi:hypothetical protein
MGSQLVKTMKGCWEVCWKRDATAGSLVCGFEVSEDYKRNDAVLPMGRIYLSFPVWTEDGLTFARGEKQRIAERGTESLAEKQEEMRKMKETNNPLMKALYYRNACAAAEKYSLLPRLDSVQMKMIPDENDIMKLQDDLLLTTKGLVWSKDLTRGKQILLGTANVAFAGADA